MTIARIIELAAAAALLAAGVYFYRRPGNAPDGKPDRYGSQGAVILLAVGAIVAIHALGLLEYRPSAAEAEMMQERAQ